MRVASARLDDGKRGKPPPLPAVGRKKSQETDVKWGEDEFIPTADMDALLRSIDMARTKLSASGCRQDILDSIPGSLVERGSLSRRSSGTADGSSRSLSSRSRNGSRTGRPPRPASLPKSTRPSTATMATCRLPQSAIDRFYEGYEDTNDTDAYYYVCEELGLDPTQHVPTDMMSQFRDAMRRYSLLSQERRGASAAEKLWQKTNSSMLDTLKRSKRAAELDTLKIRRLEASIAESQMSPLRSRRMRPSTSSNASLPLGSTSGSVQWEQPVSPVSSDEGDAEDGEILPEIDHGSQSEWRPQTSAAKLERQASEVSVTSSANAGDVTLTGNTLASYGMAQMWDGSRSQSCLPSERDSWLSATGRGIGNVDALHNAVFVAAAHCSGFGRTFEAFQTDPIMEAYFGDDEEELVGSFVEGATRSGKRGFKSPQVARVSPANKAEEEQQVRDFVEWNRRKVYLQRQNYFLRPTRERVSRAMRGLMVDTLEANTVLDASGARDGGVLLFVVKAPSELNASLIDAIQRNPSQRQRGMEAVIRMLDIMWANVSMALQQRGSCGCRTGALKGRKLEIDYCDHITKVMLLLDVDGRDIRMNALELLHFLLQLCAFAKMPVVAIPVVLSLVERMIDTLSVLVRQPRQHVTGLLLRASISRVLCAAIERLLVSYYDYVMYSPKPPKSSGGNHMTAGGSLSGFNTVQKTGRETARESRMKNLVTRALQVEMKIAKGEVPAFPFCSQYERVGRRIDKLQLEKIDDHDHRRVDLEYETLRLVNYAKAISNLHLVVSNNIYQLDFDLVAAAQYAFVQEFEHAMSDFIDNVLFVSAVGTDGQVPNEPPAKLCPNAHTWFRTVSHMRALAVAALSHFSALEGLLYLIVQSWDAADVRFLYGVTQLLGFVCSYARTDAIRVSALLGVSSGQYLKSLSGPGPRGDSGGTGAGRASEGGGDVRAEGSADVRPESSRSSLQIGTSIQGGSSTGDVSRAANQEMENHIRQSASRRLKVILSNYNRQDGDTELVVEAIDKAMARARVQEADEANVLRQRVMNLEKRRDVARARASHSAVTSSGSDRSLHGKRRGRRAKGEHRHDVSGHLREGRSATPRSHLLYEKVEGLDDEGDDLHAPLTDEARAADKVRLRLVEKMGMPVVTSRDVVLNIKDLEGKRGTRHQSAGGDSGKDDQHQGTADSDSNVDKNKASVDAAAAAAVGDERLSGLMGNRGLPGLWDMMGFNRGRLVSDWQVRFGACLACERVARLSCDLDTRERALLLLDKRVRMERDYRVRDLLLPFKLRNKEDEAKEEAAEVARLGGGKKAATQKSMYEIFNMSEKAEDLAYMGDGPVLERWEAKWRQKHLRGKREVRKRMMKESVLVGRAAHGHRDVSARLVGARPRSITEATRTSFMAPVGGGSHGLMGAEFMGAEYGGEQGGVFGSEMGTVMSRTPKARTIGNVRSNLRAVKEAVSGIVSSFKASRDTTRRKGAEEVLAGKADEVGTPRANPGSGVTRTGPQGVSTRMGADEDAEAGVVSDAKRDEIHMSAVLFPHHLAPSAGRVPIGHMANLVRLSRVGQVAPRLTVDYLDTKGAERETRRALWRAGKSADDHELAALREDYRNPDSVSSTIAEFDVTHAVAEGALSTSRRVKGKVEAHQLRREETKRGRTAGSPPKGPRPPRGDLSRHGSTRSSRGRRGGRPADLERSGSAASASSLRGARVSQDIHSESQLVGSVGDQSNQSSGPLHGSGSVMRRTSVATAVRSEFSAEEAGKLALTSPNVVARPPHLPPPVQQMRARIERTASTEGQTSFQTVMGISADRKKSENGSELPWGSPLRERRDSGVYVVPDTADGSKESADNLAAPSGAVVIARPAHVLSRRLSRKTRMASGDALGQINSTSPRVGSRDSTGSGVVDLRVYTPLAPVCDTTPPDISSADTSMPKMHSSVSIMGENSSSNVQGHGPSSVSRVSSLSSRLAMQSLTNVVASRDMDSIDSTPQLSGRVAVEAPSYLGGGQKAVTVEHSGYLAAHGSGGQGMTHGASSLSVERSDLRSSFSPSASRDLLSDMSDRQMASTTARRKSLVMLRPSSLEGGCVSSADGRAHGATQDDAAGLSGPRVPRTASGYCKTQDALADTEAWRKQVKVLIKGTNRGVAPINRSP